MAHFENVGGVALTPHQEGTGQTEPVPWIGVVCCKEEGQDPRGKSNPNMKIYLPLGLLGLLFVIRLQGADEIRYTHLVESKPVAMNGLEFVAATEDKWHGDLRGGSNSIAHPQHHCTANGFPSF
jgi:hypothetical protein